MVIVLANHDELVGLADTTSVTRFVMWLWYWLTSVNCASEKGSIVSPFITIKDLKYFTCFAHGMPGKGEMKQVIE